MTIVLIGSAAALALGLAAGSQELAAPGRYRAAAAVEIVNVEVLVTDRTGNPVPGLTAADFEVFDEGVRQAITNFYSGQAAAAAEGAEAARAGAPGRADSRVGLLVLVDNSNLRPASRDDILRHLRDVLEAGWPGPDVPVMLASGSSTSVRVVQSFTNDPKQLLDGLAALQREAATPGGAAMAGFMTQIMEHTSTVAHGASDGTEDAMSSLQTLRGAAQQAYEQGRGYMQSLSQLFDSLAGLPGRKVVLFVSNGLQTRPGEAMLQRWESVFGGRVDPGFSAVSEASRYSLSTEFRTLLQRANASRLTVVGLEGGSGDGVGAAADRRMEQDTGIGTGESLGLQQSLATLAQATGGWVLSRGSALGDHIRTAFAEIRGAYSLGYANPKPGAGTYRSIKVRVKREGLVVRHREGYLDKTPDEEMAERSLGALLAGTPGNPLDVAVTLRGSRLEKGDLYIAEMLAIVPLGNVLLKPSGDLHEGQLSMWVAVQDAEGRISRMARQLFPVRVPNERLLSAQGQSMGCTFQLRLRQGAYRVAVAVRDDVGLIDSTAVGSIEVGPAAPAGAGT
ncbi:MAG TPA: VWA domain-containing protein [Thermoanaerobaculaceae bacterium]|nr:VWA domain-containing protein [Thermoanaerobaculaceae bacterium]HRS15076.1 VWA domain-containing protein [Thermoanaerobaculaceae bacterium]